MFKDLGIFYIGDLWNLVEMNLIFVYFRYSYIDKVVGGKMDRLFFVV